MDEPLVQVVETANSKPYYKLRYVMLPLPPAPLLQTSLPLKLVSKGKVRDIYDVPPSEALDKLYASKSNVTSTANLRNGALLFIATDRISAYDVILKNGIPQKGVLLTEISAFWFSELADIVPNHVISTSLEEILSVLPLFLGEINLEQIGSQLKGRTMLVQKAKVIPIEAIVRGYLTGSAWSEYKLHTTVHSMPLPAGLVESQKFPEPVFTPSTKAELGMHDENVSPQRAREIVGIDVYDEIERISLALYKKASSYAESRGLILADTKFEFGLIDSQADRQEGSAQTSKPTLILIDELLTPDSSRYWPKEGYEPGKPQPSFDKQYLRDWMVGKGFKKGLESGPPGMESEGWVIETGVVEGTRQRYVECVEKLVKRRIG